MAVRRSRRSPLSRRAALVPKGMLRRLREALRLASAVQRLQDRLRESGTPDHCCIAFDRQSLTFVVEWHDRTVSGWPLSTALERFTGLGDAAESTTKDRQ